ncbi:FGGY-family carbohydrate kinase [Nocardiopsis coralliicola]
MSAPAAPVWVGIDIGTQGVKAVAAERGGAVAGQGSAPLRSVRGGGRHEQDPGDWWAAVGTACRTAIAAAGARPVGGTAVCATSGTALVADRHFTPRGPALMYDDAQTAAGAEELADAVGAAVWERTGLRPQPHWAFARIAHLVRTRFRPGAGDLVLHQSDYVAGRLNGGPVAPDTSHALKSGADPLAAAWPGEVRAALGAPAEALPEPVAPGTLIGAVSAAAAAHTGLPEGTPIAAGMTDGCAAQIASGALEPGAWNSVLGTTLVLKGAAEHRVADTAAGVYSHRSPDGLWWPGGASSTGAGVLSTAFPGADLAAMDAAAALDRPASAVVYPLSGRGERFPFSAPEATGFALGTPRGEADRYAAVLQGVAFLERLCLERLDALGARAAGALRVTGGAVRSTAWTQLRADVLGRPLEVPASAEPAFGMALLALSGSTDTPIAEAVRAAVRIEGRVEPRPEVGARLEEPYRRLTAALAERGWTPAASEGAA